MQISTYSGSNLRLRIGGPAVPWFDQVSPFDLNISSPKLIFNTKRSAITVWGISKTFFCCLSSFNNMILHYT